MIWVISMTAELKVPGIPGTSSADFTCSEFEQRREIMQRKCVSSSSSFLELRAKARLTQSGILFACWLFRSAEKRVVMS